MSRPETPPTSEQTWNAVDPSRPWVPMHLSINNTGITVTSRRGSVIHKLSWRDVSDIKVDGVSGFWGLRMALLIESKNQPTLRFLCPQFPLVFFPHDRVLDIAHALRKCRASATAHLV